MDLFSKLYKRRLVEKIFLDEEMKPAPRPRVNRKTGGVYYPGDYRHYVRYHAEKLRESWKGKHRTITRPVSVVFTFYRGTRRRVDLDNLEKTVMDILVKAQVIKDDSLIWEKHSRIIYGNGNELPGTEILIYRIAFTQNSPGVHQNEPGTAD